MSEKKVSVIVPIYNSSDYLSVCIESIVSQSYKNFELILINDGSTDDSEKICKKYMAIDERIIYFYQDNQGVSAARNKGLDIASGEYICFVDSDDYIDKLYIETLLNNMIANNADISICNIVSIAKHKKKPLYEGKWEGILSAEEAIKEIIKRDSNHKFMGHLVTKMFCRNIIKGIKFNTNIFVYEDMLFVYFAIKKSNKIFYSSTPLYYYVQRNDSAMHEMISEKSFSSIESVSIICKDANKYYLGLTEYLDSYYIRTNLIQASLYAYTIFSGKKVKKNFLDDIQNNLLLTKMKYDRRHYSIKDVILYYALCYNVKVFMWLYRICIYEVRKRVECARR